MKLPIKFRGVMLGGNQTACGDHVYRMTGSYIINVAGEYCRVVAESVVPLVGYDKNGKEIYEGDALVTDDGEIIIASILRHAKVPPANKDMEFTEMAKRFNWKLKNE